MTEEEKRRFAEMEREVKRLSSIVPSEKQLFFGDEIREYRAYLELHLKRVLYFLAIVAAAVGALLGKSVLEYNEIVANRVASKTEAELLTIQEKLQNDVATSIGADIEMSLSRARKDVKATIEDEITKSNKLAQQRVESFVTTALTPRIDETLTKLGELGPEDLSGKLIELARVPSGTIMAYWGTEAPGGWLVCNGDPIPEGDAYSELRKTIGSDNLPDLRGVFLRGLDAGRGHDEDRVIGHYQEDAFESHHHTLDDKTAIQDHHDQGMRFQMHGSAQSGNANNQTRVAGSVKETRPKNVAVSFVVKI